MMALLSSMAKCLILTLAIEVPLVLLLCPGARSKRGVLTAVLVNVSTNPVVASCAFFVQAMGWPYWPCVAVLELGAAGVEGFWYKRVLEGVKRPVLIAFTVNACSFLLGFLA